MAITPVASTSGRSANSNSFDLATFDSTGGNFVAVNVASAVDGVTVSDNKGNTYTPRNDNNGVFGDRFQRFFDCASANCGSGHVITINGTGTFSSAEAEACSGVNITPFDAENFATTFSNSVGTGGVTPSQNNEIVYAGLQYDDDASDPTIDGGFTVFASQRLDGGRAVGSGMARLIQTTAAAASPTWSWTNGGRCIGAVICYKESGATPPPPTASGGTLMMMGIG